MLSRRAEKSDAIPWQSLLPEASAHRNELENLVNHEDRCAQVEDCFPLCHVERSNRKDFLGNKGMSTFRNNCMTGEWKTHSEERNIKDHEMQRHAQEDRANEVHISPHREAQQTLVLRKRVHCVKHFHEYQNGETHGGRALGHAVAEHLTSNGWELG